MTENVTFGNHTDGGKSRHFCFWSDNGALIDYKGVIFTARIACVKICDPAVTADLPCPLED